MNLYCCIGLLCLLFGLGSNDLAAQSSNNTVKYQVTYDAATQFFSVWLVPQYSTPNANNVDINEYGITAQVTLKVPKLFVPTNIIDVKGTWDKNPVKLGEQITLSAYGLDPNYVYYVFGKEPSETNYGRLSIGIPIELFKFKGVSCNEKIGILSSLDPFVTITKDALSLSVACSFYSRSGQVQSGNVMPLDQFVDKLLPDVNSIPPVPSTPSTLYYTTVVGKPISISTMGISGASFTWSISPQSFIVNAIQGNIFSISPNSIGSYNIVVRQTIGGCTSADSEKVIIKVIRLLCPAISGIKI
jgi:hypothetical protein